jgi:bifunctional DNA-binding transcriptional regulator/antitoxin component of YhaV-PrlF toxin-antitoxin module
MCIQKIKIGIFSAYKYGEKSLSYTITEKGTVTIPAEVKKIRVEKRLQGQVRGDRGRILIVPVIPLEELFGVDKNVKKTVHQMIKELQEERRREASEEE